MQNWTFMQWAIAVVIVAAVVGVVMVVLPVLGITVPGWAMTIFWILVVATVAVAAIRFLVYLWRSGGS